VHDGLIIVERRCPECGHCDVVRTSRLAAQLWYRRNARFAHELAGLTDALAAGLEPDIAAPPTIRARSGPFDP
jgi:hypothetical protein